MYYWDFSTPGDSTQGIEKRVFEMVGIATARVLLLVNEDELPRR